MKKTYVAPMMEREIFETSDVITVSFNGTGFNVTPDEETTKLPVVDAATLEYKN